MKYKEVKDLSPKELKAKLAEETLNLTRMRLTHAVSQVESPMKIVLSRKVVARLKTEIRKRELNQESTK